MATAHINGVDLYYNEVGDGPPVVLIPGGNLDHRSWRDVIGQLQATHRCIVVDTRGVGGSAATPPAGSIDELAHDVVALLDHLSLERAHVAGHSLGGYVGHTMAWAYPERLHSLTLVSTGLRAEPFTVYLMNRRREIYPKLDSRTYASLVASWMFSPRTFRDAPHVVQRFVDDLSDTEVPRISQAAFAAQYDAAGSFDATERTKEARVGSCAVISGDDDVLTPPYVSEALAKALSRDGLPVNVTIVPGAGHMILLEQPGAVAKAIAQVAEAAS